MMHSKSYFVFILVPICILGGPLNSHHQYVPQLDIQQQINCTTCEQAVQRLHVIFNQNLSENDLATQVATVCNEIKFAKPIICNSIRTVLKDEILYIIAKMIKTPKHLCGYFIKDCGKPSNPFNTTWNIKLPGNQPKPMYPTLPLPNSPKLRVLHLADIHIDPDYLPGSEANCSLPLCCRDNTPFNNMSGTVKTPAGHWGTFGGKCDVPIHTVENLFQQLRDKFQFDAIYWTGDLPPHNVWDQTRKFNMDIYHNLTQLFLKYFGHKKIFSAVGNHESVPGDSFPAASMNLPSNLNRNWLYDGLAENWLKWLPKNTETSIKSKASYVTRPYTGFRLISINTQYCDKMNLWLFLYSSDPDGTLQWLSDQLYEAENAGDMVHIIGHIPPGDVYCRPTWSKNYYSIVNRFQNTIRGQFFGHMHSDTFAVFYENARRDGRPTNYYSVGPSITTFGSRNPAFKIYTIDGNYTNSSWTVLDEESYWMNITEANIKSQPQWRLLYKTKSTYKMQSLLPQDWSNLILRFKNDNSLLSSYISNFNRKPDHSCAGSASCRFDKLCQMRKATTEPNEHLCDDLHSNQPMSSGSGFNIHPQTALTASLVLMQCYIAY